MLLKMIFLQLFTIFLPYISSAYSQVSSELTFCDGTSIYTVNEVDCSSGINFGSRKPDCVCISGVYRSWTEDCDLYEGFLHQYCFNVWEDRYKVQGLRLLPDIGDLYLDTMAVFGERSSDHLSWKAYGMGKSGKTWSDTFYVVNGFPIMMNKHNDKYICVAGAVKQEKQVCRYFAGENEELWEAGEGVRILVTDDCEVRGYTMTEMKPHRCYDVIGRNDSDCRLSCENGKRQYLPGSLPPRQKKSTDGDDGGLDESTVTPLSTREPLVGDNANFPLHRELRKYTQLRQIGKTPKPDITHVSPNRTFALLEIAKEITRQFCPTDFLSDIFLDQALELFAVLHTGNNRRYFEDLEQREFSWIKEILLNCRADMTSRSSVNKFEPVNRDSVCGKDDLIGSYSFLHTDIINKIKVKRGDYHRIGKYHYVIDAVWLMIDLTHGLCYPKFTRSHRMYHLWEQASEKLFTRDIRELWYNPRVDLATYNALLSNRALVDMINLDRCTEAIYGIYIMPELSRPSIPKTLYRRRRSLNDIEKPESIANNVDVFCAKNDEEVVSKC